MMPYEKFHAWKTAHKLALEVYRITDTWAASERYKLTSQMRRAALSAPANIAEGGSQTWVARIPPLPGHRAGLVVGAVVPATLQQRSRFTKGGRVLAAE
jgi:hypothetical protein